MDWTEFAAGVLKAGTDVAAKALGSNRSTAVQPPTAPVAASPASGGSAFDRGWLTPLLVLGGFILVVFTLNIFVRKS